MRIFIVNPVADSETELHLTEHFISVIANRIWRCCGDNDELIWLKAERSLERIIEDARAEAEKSVVVFSSSGVSASAICDREAPSRERGLPLWPLSRLN